MLSIRDHFSLADNSFAWRYKSQWIEEIGRILEGHSKTFVGARMLEVGAGVHNPLGSALCSLSAGAKFAAAIEPGMLDAAHLQEAGMVGLIEDQRRMPRSQLREALTAVLDAIRKDLALPDEQVRFRTPQCELFNGAVSEYDHSEPFDIVYSNAVIEHVLDLDGACRKLFQLSAWGSIHIHKVDFIDHRYYSVPNPGPEDAFRFLLAGQEDQLSECNGLRCSEVVKIFEGAGFRFNGAPQRWTLPFPAEFRNNLQNRFRTFDPDDLSTTCAILVFIKS